MQQPFSGAKPERRKIIRWLTAVTGIYIGVGIALYFLQDYILFHPVRLPAGQSYRFDIPFHEVNIPFDATANISIIQFLTGSSKKKGVVLYFHGNRKNISWYAHFAPRFTRHGYEIWMIDYPGFGKSTGRFTEQRLYDYATQLYKLARTKFSANDIIIYGKSMGTGVASYLASVKDCKALVLETPYYSMQSLVGTFAPVYPVNNMIHYRLPVFEYLPNVTVPVIIFHGSADMVIPFANAKQLRRVLKQGDEFITIEGGSHNDLNDFQLMQHKLDSLLEK